MTDFDILFASVCIFIALRRGNSGWYGSYTATLVLLPSDTDESIAGDGSYGSASGSSSPHFPSDADESIAGDGSNGPNIGSSSPQQGSEDMLMFRVLAIAQTEKPLVGHCQTLQ